MHKRPILERLKMLGSAKTYLASDDLKFHVVIQDAIDRIEDLEAELSNALNSIPCDVGEW